MITVREIYAIARRNCRIPATDVDGNWTSMEGAGVCGLSLVCHEIGHVVASDRWHRARRYFGTRAHIADASEASRVRETAAFIVEMWILTATSSWHHRPGQRGGRHWQIRWHELDYHERVEYVGWLKDRRYWRAGSALLRDRGVRARDVQSCLDLESTLLRILSTT